MENKLIKGKNFVYDNFSDSLMVFSDNENAKENFLLGDFVISLNEKGEVVGLEIRGVSALLENYEIDPKILENMKKVELKVIPKEDIVYIFFNIESIIDLKPVKQKLPIIMPLH